MSLKDGMQFHCNVELVVVSVTVSVIDAAAKHGAASAHFCSTQWLKHDFGWPSSEFAAMGFQHTLHASARSGEAKRECSSPNRAHAALQQCPDLTDKDQKS
eukprot:1231488-Amphidinium_carterae.1